MAINPLPFIQAVPDPGQAFLQSFQAARQQRVQQDQLAQRQARYQQWIARLRQDRSPETMSEFMLEFPEASDAITKAFAPMQESERNSQLGFYGNVLSALERGDKDFAKRAATEMLTAAKNTRGKEQFAQELEYGISLLDSNPDALKASLAQSIYALDPKRYDAMYKQEKENPYVVVPGVGVVLRRDIDAAIAAGEKGGVKDATVRTQIPQGAIDMLKKNPALKPAFEEKYGVGSAAAILGGGSSNATGGFRP